MYDFILNLWQLINSDDTVWCHPFITVNIHSPYKKTTVKHNVKKYLLAVWDKEKQADENRTRAIHISNFCLLLPARADAALSDRSLHNDESCKFHINPNHEEESGGGGYHAKQEVTQKTF